MGINTVFERYEKKYMLDMSRYGRLREGLAPYMREDRYGLTTISSLYYDTDSFALIRASIEKPAFKEKLRMRCYGTPGDEDDVFLELKRKLDGVVYKRRAALPLGEARRYLSHGIPPEAGGQILEEIGWFVQRYQPRPKVVLSCDRLALAGRRDPGLRVTFDFRIRWRENHLDLARGAGGEQLVPPNRCLMEIKAPGAMPMWLGSLLGSLEIYPQSFSKYGACYKEHLLQKGGLRHAG